MVFPSLSGYSSVGFSRRIELNCEMKTLSAEYQDRRRTYRIVEQPDSGFSRAYEIAAQFGLQFKENREI